MNIVLFGATGFTGALTAEYLARAGVTGWVLAGRNATKLSALRDRLGVEVPVRVADADDPASLRRAIEDATVVISTVGPYVRYGEPEVDPSGFLDRMLRLRPDRDDELTTTTGFTGAWSSDLARRLEKELEPGGRHGFRGSLQRWQRSHGPRPRRPVRPRRLRRRTTTPPSTTSSRPAGRASRWGARTSCPMDGSR